MHLSLCSFLLLFVIVAVIVLVVVVVVVDRPRRHNVDNKNTHVKSIDFSIGTFLVSFLFFKLL